MSDVTTPGFEMVINRTLDVPREKAFAAWATSERLRQWFCPKPWFVAEADMEFRTGGHNHVVMQGPNGEESIHRGVFLDVTTSERIIFTDAYVKAWVPSENPFITATILFADAGAGRTFYTVTVAHWSEADRAKHEAMGFYGGWNIVIDQLEELAKTL
jgi:uncharacterized protein YndB with AHSA1/START domain